MSAASMSLHGVQAVVVSGVSRLGTAQDTTTREITIKLDNGSVITIELFTKNDELKLEIE